MSMKFRSKGPINNIPALSDKWLGADQATSYHLNQGWLEYRHIDVSLGFNELIYGTILRQGSPLQYIKYTFK